MIQTDFLSPRMLCTVTPDNGTADVISVDNISQTTAENILFHLLGNLLMDRVAEVLDRVFPVP